MHFTFVTPLPPRTPYTSFYLNSQPPYTVGLLIQCGVHPGTKKPKGPSLPPNCEYVFYIFNDFFKEGSLISDPALLSIRALYIQNKVQQKYLKYKLHKITK